MSFDQGSKPLKFLVAHHDILVLEDLTDTLVEYLPTLLVDRAERLVDINLEQPAYDATLAEYLRDAPPLGAGTIKRLGRLIWIVDDRVQPPETPAFAACLEQPFRTADVRHALTQAGLFQVADGSGTKPQA